MRQVFLLVFSHFRGWPAPSLAAKSCTLRANSRTRYEPGVQTGISNDSSCDPFAVRLIATSTSSKCVCGRGIATVKEISTGEVWPTTSRGRKTNQAAAHTTLRLCILQNIFREKLMTNAVECYYIDPLIDTMTQINSINVIVCGHRSTLMTQMDRSNLCLSV